MKKPKLEERYDSMRGAIRANKRGPRQGASGNRPDAPALVALVGLESLFCGLALKTCQFYDKSWGSQNKKKKGDHLE